MVLTFSFNSIWESKWKNHNTTFPFCACTNELTFHVILLETTTISHIWFGFSRCLTVLSSCCPWPPWWPPRWPMGPAAPGMPSASSSLYASGGSRGSSMVRRAKKTSIKVVLSACETDAFCGATPGNTQSLLTQRATRMHKDQLALKEPNDPILSMIIQIIYYSEQYSYWSSFMVNCCHSATLTSIDCKGLVK